MLSFGFFTFLAVATIVGFVNWRLALAMLIAVGATEDPMRKMMPGAPALMVLAFLPVWMASFVGMFSAGQWRWRYFSFHYPALRQSINLFIPALFLAVLVLLFNFGPAAWKVALIGIFSYSLPILTILMGFAYARTERDVCRFIRVYCMITAVMLTGGVLEVMHILPGWDALGTSVLGMHWIRYVSWGHTIDLIAGFYRSPDIMGWHASVLAMLSLSMALYGRAGSRWLWLLLASWGVLLVVISGRNKMLGMTGIWIGVVTLLYFYYGHLGKVFALAGIGGLLLVAVSMMSGELNLSHDYILYSTQLAHGSFIDRIDRSVFNSLAETFHQSGFFGKGIGVSAQGIQHLGVNINRSWQESGASRILVELGVIGLLAVFMFGWSMFKAIRQIARSHKGAARLPVLQISLIAFATANVSNFLISHQVYNDGYILVMLALLVGMLLASPDWSQEKRA